MKKIYVYITDILFILNSLLAAGQVQPPDSNVIIPLKIRIALEVAGPVIYFTNKDNLSIEGNISGDLNEKITLFLGAGHARFRYSQYNYSYLNNGIFLKAGVDFNLLKPQTNMGKYWAGIGVHYSLSSFNSETPFFEHNNYWGSVTSSLPPDKTLAHFLELSPGFRAEIFRNFSMGWSVSLKKLIYSGTRKDLKPLFIPGYGNGGKPTSVGINYFITLNIPYRNIRVAIKPEKPPQPQETEGQTNTINR